MSHFAESQQTVVESQVSLLAVLLPQEAKEMAAKAAKTNTKFFISFLFKSVKQSFFLKSAAKLDTFFVGCITFALFFACISYISLM